MIKPSASRPSLRIGTRASALARWQADWVADRLRGRGQAAEIIEIVTRGDQAAAPLGFLGETGVFTSEIQRALLARDVDLAVHSLKDLPTEPVAGLILAATPPRESPADVIVLPAIDATGRPASNRGALTGQSLHDALAVVPRGARVGTGSLRRQAQLRHIRPDLRLLDVRGNVDTRLRKLDEGQFDALVLAEAGLTRLGLTRRISQVLSPVIMLPAIGQGALGIECRADDETTRAALVPLDDAATRAAVLAERAMLAHLRGGCLAPIGGWGRIDDDALLLTAVVLSPDGRQRLEAHESAPSVDAPHAERLGRRVAEALLAQGAAELIAESRRVAPTDSLTPPNA
jgi:hydroxymethylbilane synthase